MYQDIFGYSIIISLESSHFEAPRCAIGWRGIARNRGWVRGCFRQKL